MSCGDVVGKGLKTSSFDVSDELTPYAEMVLHASEECIVTSI